MKLLKVKIKDEIPNQCPHMRKDTEECTIGTSEVKRGGLCPWSDSNKEACENCEIRK